MMEGKSTEVEKQRRDGTGKGKGVVAKKRQSE